MMDNLTVTNIKPFRGFLEIYGHKKPDLLIHLESEIAAYQPHIKKHAQPGDIHPNLEFDTIYLALTIGRNKYHRCTVLEKRANNKCLIELIDYGKDFEVDSTFVSILYLQRTASVSKIKFLFASAVFFVVVVPHLENQIFLFIEPRTLTFASAFKSN